MKIGDKVTYVTEKQSGKAITVSVKEGILVELAGRYGTIKLKNGKCVVVKKEYIHPVDKQNI